MTVITIGIQITNDPSLLKSRDLAMLNKIGLVMNIFGTLMIAFSFGKNLGDAYQTNDKKGKIYLASFLYPKIFWFGIALLIIGFVCQLIS